MGIDRQESKPGPDSPASPAGSGDAAKPHWANPLTMVGAFLAVVGAVLLLTFGLFAIVAPASNPYVDVLGYLVMPMILIVGLILMPLGILIRTWRLRRLDPTQKLAFRFPRIDLNQADQRKAARFFVFGTLVFLPVVAVSGYHGYHYTDSTDFCGQTCHAVMEPQATAHSLSGHARVDCAECHIGAGASWFVKSKLSGTRQVFATLAESYSRPIPPAIRHLRPARETCEECHWPARFFGAQLVELERFSWNDDNARREIKMLLKTGGGGERTGRPEGIHFHTSENIQIEFVATDDGLQEIPWVRMTDDQGSVQIYRSDGRPATDPAPNGRLRRMDCMDCHNRAAHAFQVPTDRVDLYLAVGRLDATLPAIKHQAVAAIAPAYPDTAAAEAGIADALTGFYQGRFGDDWPAHANRVQQAIDAVTEIYRACVFPYMRVDWRTYPDNIGHKVSPGCFRCHEGRHVDEQGRAISHACENCHTFLNPVADDPTSGLVAHGEFQHSMELIGLHSELRCDRCHHGGAVLVATCAGCHEEQAGLLTATAAVFEPFDIEPDPMADLDCQDCHDLTAPQSLDTLAEACAGCHDAEYAELLRSWSRETEQALSDLAAPVDERARQALEALRRAGPLHNIAAARTIAQRLRTATNAAAPGTETP